MVPIKTYSTILRLSCLLMLAVASLVALSGGVGAAAPVDTGSPTVVSSAADSLESPDQQHGIHDVDSCDDRITTVAEVLAETNADEVGTTNRVTMIDDPPTTEAMAKCTLADHDRTEFGTATEHVSPTGTADPIASVAEMLAKSNLDERGDATAAAVVTEEELAATRATAGFTIADLMTVELGAPNVTTRAD